MDIYIRPHKLFAEWCFAYFNWFLWLFTSTIFCLFSEYLNYLQIFYYCHNFEGESMWFMPPCRFDANFYFLILRESECMMRKRSWRKCKLLHNTFGQSAVLQHAPHLHVSPLILIISRYLISSLTKCDSVLSSHLFCWNLLYLFAMTFGVLLDF